MSSACCACDQPAVRVCKHPECQQNPYLCDGVCVKGMAQKLHTHNKSKDIISITHLQDKINEIQNLFDPSFTERQHYKILHQRGIDVKNTFNELVDKIVRQHKQDLTAEINVKLQPQFQMIKNHIKNGSADKIVNRKKLSQFLSLSKCDIYDFKTQRVIETMKKNVFKNLDQLTLLVTKTLLSYKEIVIISKGMYESARKQMENGMIKQALLDLKEAQQIINFDWNIYYQLGCCQQALKQFSSAQASYLQAAKLNPNQANIYNNIGNTYHERGNYQQAVKWYTQAVQIDTTSSLFLANRGDSYINLKKYQDANLDYAKALKLNPNIFLYIDQIQRIYKLMAKK